MNEICRSKWPEIRRFFSFQKQGNCCAPALQDVSLSDKTLLVYLAKNLLAPLRKESLNLIISGAGEGKFSQLEF